MRILKNVFRRKFRAFLTILGIVIGVLALVLMGSIAEKLTLLVDGGLKFYGDKVTVSEKNGGGMMGFTTSPLSTEKVAEIEKVEGVLRASASIGMLMEKEMSSVNMGVPPMIMGSDMRADDVEDFKITYKSGGPLKPEDRGKAIVGSDLVNKLNARVGGKITVRDKEYEVIGILDKTLTAPDSVVTLSLADVQEIFHADLPDVVRAQIDPSKLATSITVYAKKGYDPDLLADKIEMEVAGVKADGPTVFQKQVAEPMKPFQAVIFGVALVSLMVGGLSIINTMTMSVMERTREIGIRKAIGASDGTIIRQFVAESATIGLIGGIFGLGLGWLLTMALNAAGSDSNMAIFLLTPRLAIGSILFSLFLGVLSGLYPAWHASRMNPVTALRYE